MSDCWSFAVLRREDDIPAAEAQESLLWQPGQREDALGRWHLSGKAQVYGWQKRYLYECMEARQFSVLALFISSHGALISVERWIWTSSFTHIRENVWKVFSVICAIRPSLHWCRKYSWSDKWAAAAAAWRLFTPLFLSISSLLMLYWSAGAHSLVWLCSVHKTESLLLGCVWFPMCYFVPLSEVCSTSVFQV